MKSVLLLSWLIQSFEMLLSVQTANCSGQRCMSHPQYFWLDLVHGHVLSGERHSARVSHASTILNMGSEKHKHTKDKKHKKEKKEKKRRRDDTESSESGDDSADERKKQKSEKMVGSACFCWSWLLRHRGGFSLTFLCEHHHTSRSDWVALTFKPCLVTETCIPCMVVV